MKKIAKNILVVLLSFIFITFLKTDFYAASASLSGPSTVRAGDTITLNLNINDNGKYGLEGNLNYNSSQVTLSNVSCGISGWEFEQNGSAFIVYDNNLSKPLNGAKTVLTLKFKVNNSVSAGTKVNIAVNGIITSDGNAESNIGTASYSTTIAQPLSSNNNLSSLSVNGSTLNPAFKPGTTSYNIGEVDFNVTKLNISYKTEDSKAKVTIKGNNLSVGENTVSVIVHAENGATKTYKIKVTRKQDPNYVPSSNALLSGIKVSNGEISPLFTSDVMDYIIYLPFEYVGKEFWATGVAADSKAQGVIEGKIISLVEGINYTSVICKAEDGTEMIYKITVVVMPEYNGKVPNIEGVDDLDDDTEINVDDSTNKTDKEKNNPISVVFAVVLILILVGALIYVLYILNKRNRR